MNITIVAPYCSLPSEPHFNRFWYLAELLSQSHDVMLITSNFKHYDKSFRRPEDAESASQGRLKVMLLEESGYGKNVSLDLSLIHISEPTRRVVISYAVFCLKKKKKN